MFDSSNSHNESDGLFTKFKNNLLPAAGEYLHDAWNHKAQFAEHIAGEATTAIMAGATIGAFLPAKGPAGLLVAGVFTIPVAIKAVKEWHQAAHDSALPGADRDKIAHELARDSVSGSVDFSVNMLSGWGGAEGGFHLSRSDTALGVVAQSSQRSVLGLENESITYAASTLARGAKMTAETPVTALVDSAQRFAPKAAVGVRQSEQLAAEPVVTRAAFSARSIDPEQKSLLARPIAKLARRADQYKAVRTNLTAPSDAAPAFNTYRATLHGHTKFDDGMGTAEENYDKGKQGGLDVVFLTPHNHDGARQGVSPDDPRTDAEKGVPILAQSPEEYASIITAAKAASEPGKFYAGYGIEAGTIGPSGHGGGGHDHGSGGDDAGDHGGTLGGTHGGGRHGRDQGDGSEADGSTAAGFAKRRYVTTQIGSELDQFIARSQGAAPKPGQDPVHVTDPHDPAHDATPDEKPDGAATAPTQGADGPPFDPLAAARLTHHGGVNHINIFGVDNLIVAERQPHPVKAMFNRLIGRATPAPSALNYPDGDYVALGEILGKSTDVTGQSPLVQFNHPRFDSNSATDYGVTSFNSKQEWLDKFVRPFVRLQEVVKGEALNSNPVVDAMKPGDFDPKSFAGYIDMGVQAGPTYGRDSHFGDPGGRPAGTGLLAKTLDEPGIYDAMRNRRTFATTNYADLQGVLTANNDSIYMGTVLDQAAVPTLNLKLKVGGNIDPGAKYQIKLLADEQIGDGQVAQPIKTVNMTGADLLKSDSEVSFEPVQHKLGNSSAYYVQVSRTGTGSTTTDNLLTAPIWIEPLSGQKHGLLTHMMVGNGAQVITSPWVPRF
jgi:hypothetical protein